MNILISKEEIALCHASIIDRIEYISKRIRNEEIGQGIFTTNLEHRQKHILFLKDQIDSLRVLLDRLEYYARLES